MFHCVCVNKHYTGHITTGSWKGRGNQYIEFARVVYCKLPTNGKQLPAFPKLPGKKSRSYASSKIKTDTAWNKTQIWEESEEWDQTMLHKDWRWTHTVFDFVQVSRLHFKVNVKLTRYCIHTSVEKKKKNKDISHMLKKLHQEIREWM